MVWKNIPPYERNNWSRMNEGQRRYAMEQFNLALVRRGLPIDHPRPSIDGNDEPADSDGNTDTPAGGVSDSGGDSDSGEELEQQLHDAGQGDYRTAEEIFEEGSGESEDDEEHRMGGSGQGTAMASGGGGPSGSGTGGATNGPRPPKEPRVDSGVGIGSATENRRDQAKKQKQGGLPSGDGELLKLPNPMSSIHPAIRYYRKVHRFLSFGLAYNMFPYTVERPEQHNIYMMSSPLAHVPWERLYMYLNPAEFAVLPDGSNVNKVRCQVRIRNARIAFETNVSDSTVATLNQQRDVCYSIGLRQAINCINGSPTFNTAATAQRMIPINIIPENLTHHVSYEQALS